MPNNVELRELLAAVEAVSDLRRKETLRLVEYTEKVLSEIAKVAEKSNTSAEITINIEGWEGPQLLSVRPLGWVRGVWAVLLRNKFGGEELCLIATRTEGIALHNVPRRAWVAVARNIVALVQQLKVNAEKAANETKEAADLAEKLANAL